MGKKFGKLTVIGYDRTNRSGDMRDFEDYFGGKEYG